MILFSVWSSIYHIYHISVTLCSLTVCLNTVMIVCLLCAVRWPLSQMCYIRHPHVGQSNKIVTD